MKLIILSAVVLFSTLAHAKCDCPTDQDARGHRCGGRAAFCKPGGREPACPNAKKDDCYSKSKGKKR